MISDALFFKDQRLLAYDRLVKKLLSHKMILAWILHECLSEYQNISIHEIAEKYIEGNVMIPLQSQSLLIEGMSNEADEVRFDLRFKAIHPQSRMAKEMMINVEIQRDFYPGYNLIKRAVYYGCKMVSNQYGRVFMHSEYNRLEKVYSIWLCMNPPKSKANSMTKIGMLPETKDGTYKVDKESYDLMEVILLYIGNQKTEKKGIYQLMEVLLMSERSLEERKNILQNVYDIKIDEKMEKEVKDMAGLGAYIMERGLEQGRAQGLEQGHEISLITSIQNVMISLNINIETAMNILKIPDSRQAYYAEKVKLKNKE